MIINIPFRCCEYIIDNSFYNSKMISLISNVPESNNLCFSNNLYFSNNLLNKIEILNTDIEQTNVILFCIWFINVIMFIHFLEKK